MDSIWARIAPDNIKAAEELVDRFAAVFEMLVQNPQAGRARPDLGPNLRSFAAGHYVIFYVAQSDGIAIVRVMRGRREIGPADMT